MGVVGAVLPVGEVREMEVVSFIHGPVGAVTAHWVHVVAHDPLASPSRRGESSSVLTAGSPDGCPVEAATI